MNLFEFINKNPYICPLCESYYRGPNQNENNDAYINLKDLSCAKCNVIIYLKYNKVYDDIFFNIYIRHIPKVRLYGSYYLYNIEQNINTKEIINYGLMSEIKPNVIYNENNLSKLDGIVKFPNNLIENFISNQIFI